MTYHDLHHTLMVKPAPGPMAIIGYFRGQQIQGHGIYITDRQC